MHTPFPEMLAAVHDAAVLAGISAPELVNGLFLPPAGILLEISPQMKGAQVQTSDELDILLESCTAMPVRQALRQPAANPGLSDHACLAAQVRTWMVRQVVSPDLGNLMLLAGKGHNHYVSPANATLPDDSQAQRQGSTILEQAVSRICAPQRC